MTVLSGLEVLLAERRELIADRRVALLCNPTAVDRRLRHAADLIAERARLVLLLGPEHGVRGEAQDMDSVADDRDPQLDVPVRSLYGATLESLSPRREWLDGIDAVVVDLQDVGSRYYTYVWTTVLTMRRCAELGVQVVLLDRPNPLGGEAIEGPTIAPGFDSFVGLHPVPVRHGLTHGELARLAATELRLDVDLEVVPAHGWRRGMLFDETGLPWVLPSPNMPTLDTALVYPGGCLLEGTNVSEGRGTTRPFEICGAPWVRGERLAAALADDDLPGVRFRPLTFCPSVRKHAGRVCGGVQLHVLDRRTFRPLLSGVALLRQLARGWPDSFGWRDEPYEFVADRPAIDLLAGGPWLREGLARGASLAELTGGWRAAERDFAERRAPFLLYADAEGSA